MQKNDELCNEWQPGEDVPPALRQYLQPLNLDRLSLTPQQEIDELCNEWQPDPLEGEGVPPARQQLQPPVILSDIGPYITADGRRVLNLASTNFLGIAGDPGIRVSIAASQQLRTSQVRARFV